ncbi:MAG: sugar phosphate isomerase/epimerase [Acidobacteria bacterium]|nr:sugar phosphate isomerase/epimerase [Acidobacteriota bacterium]
MTSRRGFLGTMAAAASATGIAGAAARADDSAGFKLGIASYSFREFQRRLAIQYAKKLDIAYINIKEFHLPLNSTPEEIRKARAEFEKAGLTILGGGNVSFQVNDEADIRHKFEYAKAAGMPVIVCAPTHETLPKMEKYVKEFDIKIAVHNHGPEDKHFPTPDSVLDAVKNMDPRCGLCMDIGHSARTGADLVASVRKAGARLLDMHVKDLKDTTNRDSQVPVGDGVLPIPGIFAELKKMNYQGGVMLEYEIEGDNPVPGMMKSFAYMRGVLAGLGFKG